MEQKFTAAVVTVSDRSYRGERPDAGGPCLQELLEQYGFAVCRSLVPDEQGMIEAELRRLVHVGVQLIATTGGTGFSPWDVTPEATAAVCERMVPGIPEAMRRAGMEHTPKAMLSRGVCGISGRTLILNLPGNPKSIREELPAVLPSLLHGLEILSGVPEEETKK